MHPRRDLIQMEEAASLPHFSTSEPGSIATRLWSQWSTTDRRHVPPAEPSQTDGRGLDGRHAGRRLYGTVMVVLSPLAVTENVPVLLDV